MGSEVLDEEMDVDEPLREIFPMLFLTATTKHAWLVGVLE